MLLNVIKCDSYALEITIAFVYSFAYSIAPPPHSTLSFTFFEFNTIRWKTSFRSFCQIHFLIQGRVVQSIKAHTYMPIFVRLVLQLMLQLADSSAKSAASRNYSAVICICITCIIFGSQFTSTELADYCHRLSANRPSG